MSAIMQYSVLLLDHFGTVRGLCLAATWRYWYLLTDESWWQTWLSSQDGEKNRPQWKPHDTPRDVLINRTYHLQTSNDLHLVDYGNDSDVHFLWHFEQMLSNCSLLKENWTYFIIKIVSVYWSIRYFVVNELWHSLFRQNNLRNVLNWEAINCFLDLFCCLTGNKFLT